MAEPETRAAQGKEGSSRSSVRGIWTTCVVYLGIPAAAYIALWSALLEHGADNSLAGLASLAAVLIIGEVLRQTWLVPRVKRLGHFRLLGWRVRRRTP